MDNDSRQGRVGVSRILEISGQSESVKVHDRERPASYHAAGLEDIVLREFREGLQAFASRLGPKPFRNQTRVIAAMREFAGVMIAGHELRGTSPEKLCGRVVVVSEGDVVDFLSEMTKRIERREMLRFEAINQDECWEDEALKDPKALLPNAAMLSAEYMMANVISLVRAFCSCLAYGKVPVWYWDERRNAPLIEHVEREVEQLYEGKIAAMVAQLVSDIEIHGGPQVTPEIRATLRYMVVNEYVGLELANQKTIFDRLRKPFGEHGGWIGIRYNQSVA